MNKIFRIVWSQATQSWVVVSELTRAHKKQSSSNTQKSAVKFSGRFIKYSAVALTLLSGHSAYAAVNAAGTGADNSVAWGGGDANASGGASVALGTGAQASGGDSFAVLWGAKATGHTSMAIGNRTSASGANSIALGSSGTKTTSDNAVAIGTEASASVNNAVAFGAESQATGAASVALGVGSKATGNDAYAIGWGSNARNIKDIAFGNQAETRDQGRGYSIAIGAGAMSGSNAGNLNRNGDDAGGVAIGTGAYTGVNRDDATSINSSVAIGAGAGAGFRKLDTNNNNMPIGNATDVDTNEQVLQKAFGIKDVNTDFQRIAGGKNGYTNVDINEATALGRNARAIGDQAVAIGA